jgi:hypothetical protein
MFYYNLINTIFNGKKRLALLKILKTLEKKTVVAISKRIKPAFIKAFHWKIGPAPLPILLNIGFFVKGFQLHTLIKIFVLFILFNFLNCLENLRRNTSK